MTARNPAQEVDAIGLRLFGPEWAAPMARLTGVHVRTLRRVRAAAREGMDYAGARGVLAALHGPLAAILADLEPHARPPAA